MCWYRYLKRHHSNTCLIYLKGSGGVYVGISGELSSPNFPETYPDNVICEYVVASINGNISLYFEEMELETSDVNCTNDYVMVCESIMHTILDLMYLTHTYELAKVPKQIQNSNHMV